LDFFFWELFRPIRAENGEFRWPGVPARQGSQPYLSEISRFFSCGAFSRTLNAPAAVLPSPFASCFFSLCALFLSHTSIMGFCCCRCSVLLHTQVDVGMPPRNGQRPAAKKKSVRPTLLLLCGRRRGAAGGGARRPVALRRSRAPSARSWRSGPPTCRSPAIARMLGRCSLRLLPGPRSGFFHRSFHSCWLCRVAVQDASSPSKCSSGETPCTPNLGDTLRAVLLRGAVPVDVGVVARTRHTRPRGIRRQFAQRGLPNPRLRSTLLPPVLPNKQLGQQKGRCCGGESSLLRVRFSEC
jgi:hypothetical protein